MRLAKFMYYLPIKLGITLLGSYTLVAMESAHVPLLSEVHKTEDSPEKNLDELAQLADLFIKQGSPTSLVPLHKTSLTPLDLAFYNAVLRGENQQIMRCLFTGVSLQTRDVHGKTVFHHLASKDKEAYATMCVLIGTPRKYVVDTVRSIISRGNVYSRLTKWHIAGLVRVLMMQDNDGNIPLDYIDHNSPDQLQCFFQIDPEYIEKYFGKEITLKYIEVCKPQKKQ